MYGAPESLSVSRSTRVRSDKSPAHQALVDATSSAYRLERGSVAPVPGLQDKVARQRVETTREVLAAMLEALELVLIEVAVDVALDIADEAGPRAMLVDFGRTALQDLRNVGDGIADENAAAAVRVERCRLARTRMLDIGLALEQMLADQSDRASALRATRRLVDHDKAAGERVRDALATQLRHLASTPGGSLQTARQLNVCIARTLVDAPPDGFDHDELVALRGLCERVLELLWTPSDDVTREDVARGIVADAEAFASLLSHEGPRWADAA